VTSRQRTGKLSATKLTTLQKPNQKKCAQQVECRFTFANLWFQPSPRASFEAKSTKFRLVWMKMSTFVL